MNPIISYLFTSKIGKFCWSVMVVTALLAILHFASSEMKGFGPTDQFMIMLGKLFQSIFEMFSGLIDIAKRGDKAITYALGGCAGGCLLQKALPDGSYETFAMLVSIALWVVAVVN
jgi:hypothetical protein